MPLIIDTDASFDVDDVVAICMAHALMDNGEVISVTLMRSDNLMVSHLILKEMGKTCNVMIADSRLQSKNADCNGDGNADGFSKRNFYDFSGIH